MKIFFKAFLFILALFVIAYFYGILFPILISAKSSLAVALGVVLYILLVLGIFSFIIYQVIKIRKRILEKMADDFNNK